MRWSRIALLICLTSTCQSAERASSSTTSLPVTTRDFAFETLDSVPAGRVRMVMTNAGPSYHHVQLIRWDRDLTWQQVVDSLPEDGAILPWMIPVGGIEGPDDYSLSVTVDLDLDAGVYLFICRIWAPDKRAHSAYGMVRPLYVVGSGVPPPPRAANEVPIDLNEYAFTAPDTLRAGTHALRVENRGREEHHIAVARLAPGKSAADAMREQAPNEPPAFVVVGGTASIGPGLHNTLHVSLAPGPYLLICFVLDRARVGKRHYELGMIRSLTVTN